LSSKKSQNFANHPFSDFFARINFRELHALSHHLSEFSSVQSFFLWFHKTLQQILSKKTKKYKLFATSNFRFFA